MAGGRIEDRDGCAGERAQTPGVVLIRAHQGRDAVSEGKPKSVGADLAFGVGEAGRQVHVVERLQDAVVSADPVEHDPVCVGQHQADGLVGDGPLQVEKHLAAAFVEQRLLGVGAREDGFDGFQRDAVVLAALPRREQPTEILLASRFCI
ncbi:MAG: hypothetical protein JWR37_1326 [Mycobacterium sp.]|nr:hypothetical protein [Mycobacterium sp.]